MSQSVTMTFVVTITLHCYQYAISLQTNITTASMLSKMAKHARKLQVKSSELSSEKRRADTLLCQMLPKEVAEQLKMNREVKAEHSGVKVKGRRGRGDAASLNVKDCEIET